jgi:hypothetical protein
MLGVSVEGAGDDPSTSDASVDAMEPWLRAGFVTSLASTSA